MNTTDHLLVGLRKHLQEKHSPLERQLIARMLLVLISSKDSFTDISAAECYMIGHVRGTHHAAFSLALTSGLVDDEYNVLPDRLDDKDRALLTVLSLSGDLKNFIEQFALLHNGEWADGLLVQSFEELLALLPREKAS